MFPSSSQIKTKALELLRGKWPYAISATLIPVFFSLIYLIIFDFFHSISGARLINFVLYIPDIVVCLFMFIPLLLGTVRFFTCLNDNQAPQLENVFAYFSCRKMYSRALKISIYVCVKLIIIGFFLFLPSILTDFVASGGFSFLTGNANPIWFGSLWIISLFLRGIAIVFLIIIILKYYMIPYVFVVNDDLSAREAIRLSTKVSAISFSNFSGLFFGLLGWIILSVAVVPIMFTAPYILTCFAVHCKAAAQFHNKIVESLPKND